MAICLLNGKKKETKYIRNSRVFALLFCVIVPTLLLVYRKY